MHSLAKRAAILDKEFHTEAMKLSQVSISNPQKAIRSLMKLRKIVAEVSRLLENQHDSSSPT